MNRQKSIAIVVLVIASVVALWVLLFQKLIKPSTPTTPTSPTEFPETETGLPEMPKLPEDIEQPTAEPYTPSWLDELEKSLVGAGKEPTSKVYREVMGTAEVMTEALTEEKVSLPEVYAQTCPPLLYRVKYIDKTTHQWTEKTVLATSSNAAAASLGLVAGYDCFVSSMSGEEASLSYHQTGTLPAETIVASQETIAQAAEQKQAAEAQKEIDEATVKAYTSYPRLDKIGVSLLCSPPTGRSLSSSEKEKINALLAKDPSYVAEVKEAYRAYALVKGLRCIC